MLFKNTLFILFVFLFFSNSNAQEFKLGKVSIAELEEKEHPKDPSATAAILFRTGEVHFEYVEDKGFIMVLDVKTRVKIYKKEGYNWANQEMRYYANGDSKEKVYFSDAVTYNLVNGKIEKTKLKSDGEFDEKINKYWNRKKIAMPNVKEGSIIEYEYRLESPRFYALRDWYFQSSIPVNHSEFKTYIPEYYEYKIFQKGVVLLKTTNQMKTRLMSFSYTEDVIPGMNQDQPKRITTSKEFLENVTTYSSENIPAMREESFVNNIDNYTASIAFELSRTKFSEVYKTYSTDWESVVKRIYEDEDFGPELDKTGYFEDDMNTLINGNKTQDELIGAIFDYVKTNMKWNGMSGYSCNDGVRKAYKEKVGNSAEINLMLTAMLRYAGFNAYPVLISTRSNGIAFFPSIAAYNHVIAAIELNGSQILLDATNKYAVSNILPLKDLNWFGRLIRKDGTSSEVELMPKIPSRATTLMTLAINSNGEIDGKLQTQFDNYKALEYRKKEGEKNQDIYLEELENKYNNIEISDYKIENANDLSKPISESYSFKSNKGVEIINDKIYISPLLFLAYKENPFKQEVREYPVDFSYPFLDRTIVTLEIPKGYIVESMPASINIAAGKDVGAFKFMLSNADNKIQLSNTEVISTAIVPSDFYGVLKAYYKQIVDKQNEKIVLKKI